MSAVPRRDWIPEVPFDSSDWADVDESTPAWDSERLARAVEKQAALPIGPPVFDELKADAGELAYDETKHPRDPGGEGGGRWIPKGTSAPGDAIVTSGTEENVMLRDGLSPYIYPAPSLIRAQTEAWQGEGAKAAADDAGMTLEQYHAAVDQRLRETLDNAVLEIRTPVDLIDEVATEAAFKNQFQSGSSRGAFNPGFRAEQEAKLFQIPVTAPGAERPIYAYAKEIHKPASGGVNQYGDVVWELKPDVKKRATFTGGDSLGGRFAPFPVVNPSHLSLPPPPRVPGSFDLLRAPLETGESYPEVQIHGGLTLDDVAAVTVPRAWAEKPDVAKALGELRRRGITVEFVDDTWRL